MRLDKGGLIDRVAPVPFTWNGQDMSACRGDTLASALLANGVRVVGRSFKYHRPRGIFGTGSEEPNALVTLGRGALEEPNVRATMVPVSPGLTARPQNYTGHVNFDLMAVNDWLSPFIGAGFYYKTFMWPKSWWERVYEPAIRRAAGLGALTGAADEDLHEKAFAHCDLLVIGGGPAGLMAALTAGRAGFDVILADEDFLLGGRLLSEIGAVGDQEGADWAAAVADELDALPNVRVMRRTTVTGVYDGGVFGALSHSGPHAPGLPRTCFWRITAREAVLASGATERPIAFANNDRPGVMLASAVRTYAHRFGVSTGRRVVVFGASDEVGMTVRSLLAAGVNVRGAVDARETGSEDLPCPVYQGAAVIGTIGRMGLTSLRLRLTTGREMLVDCDCLAVAGGWNPTLHLSSHLGAKPVWRQDIAAFVPPPSPVRGLRVAGAANGTFSTQRALIAGATVAAAAMGLPTPDDVPQAEDGAVSPTTFWQVSGRGRAWVDLQNDVTVGDLVQARDEGFFQTEHAKRYTTLGMAPDQGRTSNVLALGILSEITGRAMPQTGTTTFRPPFTPVPFASLGAGGKGRDFAPERLTPSHDLSLDRGAVMIEAGLWHRAAYYPLPGDTHWRQACDREVNLVRQSVGLTDVTTLGKIEVSGPDAAKFLDFVYSGRMAALAEGKVRYGVMLREDGHVMDDGTVARLGPTHYVLTTTTGAAADVWSHLTFVKDCLKPRWDLALAPVTEAWAQFAVTGPVAREVLTGIVDTDLSDGALPFMGVVQTRLNDVPARLFRISFTGELGYELAVPIGYGRAVFARLEQAVTALGGGLFGLEALNVLRLEKGYPTHAEMDGRVTAGDLGLTPANKDAIGIQMAGRSGLSDPARPVLVGLRPVGAVKKMVAGAHLVMEEAEPLPQNDEGWVSSVCYSPTLGHMIGLGFLANGRKRLGERVRAVDLLRDIDTLCEVTDLPFFDPRGRRMRG